MENKVPNKRSFHTKRKKRKDNASLKTQSDKDSSPSSSRKKISEAGSQHIRPKESVRSPKRERFPVSPPVVFANCALCSAGISNEAYAIKIKDDVYIHFECSLKKIKELVQKPHINYGKRLKYTYMGSNTFAVYLEQGGNPYSWKILQKIKIDKILENNLKVKSSENA